MNIEKVRFDRIYPDNKWMFILTWKNKEQIIEGVSSEIQILIEAKTEKEATKMFHKFIKAIRERDVMIEND